MPSENCNGHTARASRRSARYRRGEAVPIPARPPERTPRTTTRPSHSRRIRRLRHAARHAGGRGTRATLLRGGRGAGGRHLPRALGTGGGRRRRRAPAYVLPDAPDRHPQRGRGMDRRGSRRVDHSGGSSLTRPAAPPTACRPSASGSLRSLPDNGRPKGGGFWSARQQFASVIAHGARDHAADEVVRADEWFGRGRRAGEQERENESVEAGSRTRGSHAKQHGGQ